MRYLFYSHDGQGLGHTCRNLAIARAVTERDSSATVLLVTGTDDALQLGLPPRVEIVKLPSLRKIDNGHYSSRRLLVSEERIRRLRASLLSSAVQAFQPHLLLADKHPLGASGELRKALSRLRAQGGRAALGLRDILDDPATMRAEWASHSVGERIAELYDGVLIYGQRELFDPVHEYGLPSELASRTVFCGYVIHDECLRRGASGRDSVWPRDPRPRVVATVGGGEDGDELLQNFLKASAGASWSAVAVMGPFAPEESRQRLGKLARRVHALLREFVPRLRTAFRDVDALVCMGGYNTLAEALSVGVPVVCVPRVHPRREQLIRAEAFERHGLLECLLPERLSPGALRDAITRALAQSRPALAQRCLKTLRFDGAARAAAMLAAMARGNGEPLRARRHPPPRPNHFAIRDDSAQQPSLA